MSCGELNGILLGALFIVIVQLIWGNPFIAIDDYLQKRKWEKWSKKMDEKFKKIEEADDEED